MPHGCTDILLLPIAVTIEPRDLTVDSVTSHNEGERSVDCQRGFRSRTMFSCREQGAGTYTVQVTSGELTWTQTVELHADECHVTDTAKLTFELDPATTD
ncbi:MAG TPA: hypothetical protein VJV78_48525 [Polyangiales bacterium]|nr:hypothetical protein [Polyangiales bacterium]